ncbi:hypothetical protein AUJ14_00270 [Candidatus Micrarchaeota archaeon CG1_02_55_22]|nr:MAG: hypothetical protein AUJ14_00270 [Candidatus Micrarchaeota archaeon CG1_02_55_22]
MIPVSPKTKKLVDEKKKRLNLRTYDETIAALARPNIIEALAPFEGILKGAPKFKRDSLDRKIA